MDPADLQSLLDRARGDDPRAQQALAEVLARAELAVEARQWMERAATTSRSALGRLGMWDIAGFGATTDATRGVQRVLAAAADGDADSMHFAAVLHAGGIGLPVCALTGLDWLRRAAEAGLQQAHDQLLVLAALGGNEPAGAEESAVHARARDRAALAWASSPIQRQCVREAPHIETIPGLLPGPVCEYVIRRAQPLLQRGRIVGRDGAEHVSEVRSNAVVNFGLAECDFVLELVNTRCALAAGMPAENAEGLGVLHYRPGESYAPHVDYYAQTPANAAHLAASGQRARTLLVYLNDDYTGGETEFARLDLRFRLPVGDALLFHSVDASGRVDPLTVHAGRTPLTGEKWLISKWFRTRALRPGPGAG